LLFQHGDAGCVRRDHTKVSNPTALRDFGRREIDARLDFLCVEALEAAQDR
jgi:hypothetical protein